MLMTIRWVPDTVELVHFPGQAQETLRNLNPGTFTTINVSTETKLFVKRLTQKTYQVGVSYVNRHLCYLGLKKSAPLSWRVQ
ncbi:MAG TPA: hypothetical protein VFP40_11165 [Terriglobales bacterium]|nr:hypothetical protein [Terriglobales bacterium]